MKDIILPKGERADKVNRLCNFLSLLSTAKAWEVSVKEYHPTRSLNQNALLWRIYGQAIERGGNTLAGFTKEEIHEVMLESFAGFEKYTLLGIEKTRALQRSKDMDKMTFADFIAHVDRVLSEQGILVDMPEGL